MGQFALGVTLKTKEGLLLVSFRHDLADFGERFSLSGSIFHLSLFFHNSCARISLGAEILGRQEG